MIKQVSFAESMCLKLIVDLFSDIKQRCKAVSFIFLSHYLLPLVTFSQEARLYRIWFVLWVTDVSLRKFKDVLMLLVSVMR